MARSLNSRARFGGVQRSRWRRGCAPGRAESGPACRPRSVAPGCLALRAFRVLGFAILSLAAGCVNLYERDLGTATVDYWFADFEGDVSVVGGLFDGTRIDVEDTLDLKDEDILGLRGFAQIGNVSLEATHFEVDYSGENELTQTIRFGGEDFTFGTTLSSEVDLRMTTGRVKLGLLRLGPIAVGATLGGGYFRSEATLSSPLLTQRDDLEFAFPLVGGVVAFNQPLGDGLSLTANAEASGFAIDAFDLRGGLVEALGQVGLRWRFAQIAAGYRLLAVDLEETDDDLEWDLSLSGPFIGIEIGF